MDGLRPFTIPVNDQIECVAGLRHQRNELLTTAIGIIGVVIVHQCQVALRGQSTGFLIGHGDYIFFIGGRSQDRLFHFLRRLTAIGKSRSRHASAQCHRQHQGTELIHHLHYQIPPC